MITRELIYICVMAVAVSVISLVFLPGSKLSSSRKQWIRIGLVLLMGICIFQYCNIVFFEMDLKNSGRCLQLIAILLGTVGICAVWSALTFHLCYKKSRTWRAACSVALPIWLAGGFIAELPALYR